MKLGIKIVLIVISALTFLFCLSGVFMAGSFSVSAPLEQKEHYESLIMMYGGGSLSSLFLMGYLIFSKVNK